MIGLKKCSVCKVEKSKTTDFRKCTKNRDGLQYHCKACAIQRYQQWMISNPGKRATQSRQQRLKNPEASRAASKKWRKGNPDKIKARHLRKKYGITLEQWNLMFSEQQGCCAVCGVNQDKLKYELHVDHCHKTGKVRKLLCFACNHGIGYFRDNPELLKKTAQYLESF